MILHLIFLVNSHQVGQLHHPTNLTHNRHHTSRLSLSLSLYFFLSQISFKNQRKCDKNRWPMNGPSNFTVVVTPLHKSSWDQIHHYSVSLMLNTVTDDGDNSRGRHLRSPRWVLGFRVPITQLYLSQPFLPRLSTIASDRWTNPPSHLSQCPTNFEDPHKSQIKKGNGFGHGWFAVWGHKRSTFVFMTENHCDGEDSLPEDLPSRFNMLMFWVHLPSIWFCLFFVVNILGCLSSFLGIFYVNVLDSNSFSDFVLVSYLEMSFQHKHLKHTF